MPRRLTISACLICLLVAASAAAQAPPPPSPTGAEDNDKTNPAKNNPQNDPGSTTTQNAPPPDNTATTAAPAASAKSDDRTPRASIAGDARPTQEMPGIKTELGPIALKLQGYFRAPLRLGLQSGDVHTPRLVDDNYFGGFGYTRIQEADWAEVFLTGGNQWVTGTVALMASLYSDAARPLAERQLGIAQGYVTMHWEHALAGLQLRAQLKGGSFWDRFGWVGSYDTYLFGRTHQLGAQLRVELGKDTWSAWALYGVGTHLENADARQGLTLLDYAHAGVGWRPRPGYSLGGGLYYLDGQTRDRQQLMLPDDDRERVAGIDARIETPYTGRLYLAASRIDARRATYLAPVFEVLHSNGGRGLAENYLGEDGTGSLDSLGLELEYSVKRLLDAVHPVRRLLRSGDVTLRLFTMYLHVDDQQAAPALDRRSMTKWGGEGAWQALSWLGLALRYDRVSLDDRDPQSRFQILSPRVIFTTHYFDGAVIYFQYSHYAYGEHVGLRSQEGTAVAARPDEDVLKMQAQFAF